MGAETILRLGCYKEINIHTFYEWLTDKYFKSTNKMEGNLYLDKYDVEILLNLDEEEEIISLSWKLIDTTDNTNKFSENLKREIREVTRGE